MSEDCIEFDNDGYNKDFVASELFGDNACKYDPSDITWCQEWNRYFKEGAAEPCGVVGGYFGNEFNADIWYHLQLFLLRLVTIARHQNSNS